MGFETKEYMAIHENYTTLAHLKPLLLGIKLLNFEQLEITWIEGPVEHVLVGEDGWYVLEDPSLKRYPTFESLAMHRSPQFRRKWCETLNALLLDPKA